MSSLIWDIVHKQPQLYPVEKQKCDASYALGVSEDIKNYAKENIKRLFLNENFAMLILRRGDRIRQYKQGCASARNVVRVFLSKTDLTKSNINTVLIATDERNIAYQKQLKTELSKHFKNVVNEDEFSTAPDNYFKFVALRYIFATLASKRFQFHPDKIDQSSTKICPSKHKDELILHQQMYLCIMFITVIILIWKTIYFSSWNKKIMYRYVKRLFNLINSFI